MHRMMLLVLENTRIRISVPVLCSLPNSCPWSQFFLVPIEIPEQCSANTHIPTHSGSGGSQFTSSRVMGHNPEGFLIAPPASNSASSLKSDVVSSASRGAVCGGFVTNTARAFYPRLRTSLRPEPDQMEC